VSEMSTQEEREQALVEALKTVQMFSEDCGCELYEHCDYCERKREVVEILSECSILPRADYDAMLAERAKLRRALWEFMEGAAGYGLEDYPTPIATWDAMKALDILGFRNKIGNWTPAAHEFAAEMREKKTP